MSYKETEQDICPICDSPNTKRGMYDKDGDEFFQIITCQDCGFMGKQWYELSFTCISDIDSKPIEDERDYCFDPCPFCGKAGGH